MRSKCIMAVLLLQLFIVKLFAQTQTDNSRFNIYFIGDAGKESTSGNTLDILKNYLDKEGSNSAVVFLGDNIYPVGLPDSNDKGRKDAEEAIKSQMDILKAYKGKIVFIPGNHDWRQGKPNGLASINRQEVFVENYLNKGNVFLPDNGCPGPVEVPLSDKSVLIIIDTEWWLYEHEKPGKPECDIANDADFILQVKYALLRNKDKQIIVAAHHPLYSGGAHGGHFPVKDHIFPLTEINKNLWIPLPVLGSLYTVLRKNIQDIKNERYQLLKTALNKEFEQYKNLIYVSGHEHNLELFHKNDHYYIISGSGSKTTYVKKKGTVFSASKNGFVQLKLKDDEGANLSFIESELKNPLGKLAYDKKLEAAVYVKRTSPSLDSLIKDNHVTVAAGNEYGAGKFKQALLGKHYRKEWGTPVEVEVLDINTAKGRLTPVKRGGGNQTKSLRLKNADGKEFVLRQIDKSPDKALPIELRGSFASDFVKDQISSANPYAPLAVAPLALAAGVYHTNPKFVFVPSSKQLGDFDEEFGNTYCLLEERLVDDQSDNPLVGNSEKVITSEKMFKKYFGDNDHRIDQKAFLNARLFDMLIGDWDRHEDQWTWASFKDGKTTWYRPVPRDRDQAFSKLDGIIPYLGTRKWALRRTQNFGKNITDVYGLMWAGRGLDRLFTTELTKDDWRACVAAMKKNITDEVIDSAIRTMPANIFELSGKEIIEKLKARRNQLEKYAIAYYKFVSQQVEITGTDEKEYFEITRLPENKTSVKIFKINKEGEKGRLFFDRTFNGSETKEIRIFGLAGDDVFDVKGKTNKGTRIRIIGGTGKDRITDSSFVKGTGKKTKVYDTPGNIILPSTETHLFISKDTSINSYRPKSFQYNWSAPAPAYGYNPDDGIFVGYGRTIRRYKWGKKPFGSLQTITANYAFKTSSFNIDYKGIFKQVIGKWDFNLDAHINAPNNTFFYYGYGNETILPAGKKRAFNRIRSNQYILSPSLAKDIGRKQQLVFGIGYKSIEVEPNDKRFVSDPDAGINPELFSTHSYGKVFAAYHLNSTNNKLYPTQGIKFNAGINYNHVLNKAYKEKFLNYSADLSFYIPFKSFVFAHRTGFETNDGTFDFYDANTLGFKTNLRGYRAMRFTGKTVFYQNTELRLKLTDLKGYIFRGKLGIFGFFDDGRVWVPGESSNKIHVGYGGGIYFSPFNMLSLTAFYSVSGESKVPGIRLGFFF
ncbi:MAG: metallophosphoesterase [Ferruginibacter sp.]